MKGGKGIIVMRKKKRMGKMERRNMNEIFELGDTRQEQSRREVRGDDERNRRERGKRTESNNEEIYKTENTEKVTVQSEGDGLGNEKTRKGGKNMKRKRRDRKRGKKTWEKAGRQEQRKGMLQRSAEKSEL